MIPQSSASERIENARKALSTWDDGAIWSNAQGAHELANALRALIAPPATLEKPEEIAIRLLEDLGAREPFIAVGIQKANLTRHVKALMTDAVHAGIQAAWESWEPDAYALEYGDADTYQEAALKALGIDYTAYPDHIFIAAQEINRED